MKKKQHKKKSVKIEQPRDVAHGLYERIALVIRGARANVIRSIDTTMVKSYWLIGRYIVEEEQGGVKRAGYGKELLKGASINPIYGDKLHKILLKMLIYYV